jgi:hypothetical protein
MHQETACNLAEACHMQHAKNKKMATWQIATRWLYVVHRLSKKKRDFECPRVA